MLPLRESEASTSGGQICMCLFVLGKQVRIVERTSIFSVTCKTKSCAENQEGGGEWREGWCQRREVLILPV